MGSLEDSLALSEDSTKMKQNSPIAPKPLASPAVLSLVKYSIVSFTVPDYAS